MKKLGVDVMITGSQKALACPPGISVIVLSQEAIERVNRNEVKCMYLDLKKCVKKWRKRSDTFYPSSWNS